MLELDTAKADEINNFIKRCEETNTISRDAVLSIEAFVGAPIITTVIPKNRFTVMDSAVSLDEAVRTVKTVMRDVKITDVVTFDALVNKVISILPEVRFLRDNLIMLSKLEQDTLDRFLNEKYTYSYMGRDRVEKTEVVNIAKDIGVYDALRYRYDYVSSVFDVHSNGMYGYDRLMEHFNSFKDKFDGQSDFVALPLLYFILNNEIDAILHKDELILDEVTVCDMVKFISNIDKKIDEANKLYTRLQSDIENIKSDVMYYSRYSSDVDYRQKEYTKYCNVYNLMTDFSSHMIIKAFTFFAIKNRS